MSDKAEFSKVEVWWVPNGYRSKARIKDDDIPMITLEEYNRKVADAKADPARGWRGDG